MPTRTPRPQRIKRERTAGWLRGDAVIVDRSSRYGNPWRIIDGQTVLNPDGTTSVHGTPAAARGVATARFREWLAGDGPDTWRIGRKTLDRRVILGDLHLLRGKDLACTCPLPEPGEPDGCHGAYLRDLVHQSRFAAGVTP
ncbi:DUF4326 domain-containing protein [Streptomyces aculeolatus]